MPLTHVCIWTKNHWKRITLDEVKRIHSGGTVSARSGIFMCDLCGQYVTLTDGPIRDRYFRHDSSSKSKNCPDRSLVYTQNITFSAVAHNLPIKIEVLSQNSFRLYIGLISIPDSIKVDKEKAKVQIATTQNASLLILGEYSLSRLQELGTTYFSLGNSPKSSYQLEVLPHVGKIHDYWPPEVEGIEEAGSLFDSVTMKKLPLDADITINHTYLLLTRRSIFNIPKGIISNKICSSTVERGSRWNVYEVTATDFRESIAKFFLDYRCRLTESVLSIVPIWPAYVETPYLLRQCNKYMAVYMHGDATMKMFPPGSLNSYPCSIGKLFYVRCKDRQQIISAGRARVLQYLYIWKEDTLENLGKKPEILIKDITGNIINEDNFTGLPIRRTLIIKAPFDGLINIKYLGRVIGKEKLQSNNQFMLNDLRTGITIEVFQGLDLIRKVELKKEIANISLKDRKMLKLLQSCHGPKVKITHLTTSLILKMKDYPLSKRWLRYCIIKGCISLKACKVLIKHFT